MQQLSIEQQAVIKSLEEGKNILVTGGAGTGKSFILNFIKKKYSGIGLEVTASTGIASVNIGGSTIYSWAGIGLGNLPAPQIIDNLFSARGSKARSRIKRTKILAIDEISMISANLLELLDLIFKTVRNSNLPMGGMQILLFGDFLQLPPVNKSGEEVNFCFSSSIWKELNLSNIVLKQIFRQKDMKFIKILNNLRVGKIDDEDKEVLKSRIQSDEKNNDIIRPTILTTHNHKAELINNEEMSKIKSPKQLYQAVYEGAIDKIEYLKKNCLAQDNLSLKINAQVMMIKNTYQKDGIINGSLGIVRDFSVKKNYPIVEFINGNLLTISPEEWLIERFDELKQEMIIEAKMTQIPLIPSWAITIHKSQGLTLDKIYCDLSDIFTAGQAYVALSRARNIENVFIKAINFNKIYANKNVIDFYRDIDEI